MTLAGDASGRYASDDGELGARVKRRLLTALVIAATLVLLVSTAAVAAEWPYVIHQLTNDTLTQESVSVSGRHLFWVEAQEIYHPDGTATHTPYVGRYLDRTTGATTEFDREGGGLTYLSAEGDWAVYGRMEETTTVRAWNAVTGERESISATEWVVGPAVTDGEWVAWLGGDSSVMLCPLGSGTPRAVATGASSTPAIDAGRVCWSILDQQTGATGILTYDCTTGETASVTVPGFSAGSIDISGPLVIATGETPDYQSHVYAWDTRTDSAERIVSSHPDYVSRAFISGTRVVCDWLPVGGYRQVRVFDLATGLLTPVTPDTVHANAWSFDGSVVGIALKHPSDTSTLEVAWCDLDEGSSRDAIDASIEDPAEEGEVAATPITDAAEVTPAASEATTTAEATGAPSRETTAPAAGVTSPPSPATASSDADTGGGIALPAALAVGALALLGGGATVVRRRTRSTP